MRYRILLLCLLGMTVASGLHAQRPTKDKEKARQWQSMENGPWDFAPDWYYFQYSSNLHIPDSIC